MGFSRQEYWSGLSFPPPGDLLKLGIKTESLTSPSLQADSLSSEPPGNQRYLSISPNQPLFIKISRILGILSPSQSITGRMWGRVQMLNLRNSLPGCVRKPGVILPCRPQDKQWWTVGLGSSDFPPYRRSHCAQNRQPRGPPVSSPPPHFRGRSSEGPGLKFEELVLSEGRRWRERRRQPVYSASILSAREDRSPWAGDHVHWDRGMQTPTGRPILLPRWPTGGWLPSRLRAPASFLC